MSFTELGNRKRRKSWGAGSLVWEVLSLGCLSDISAEMSSWRWSLWVWRSERGTGVHSKVEI